MKTVQEEINQSLEELKSPGSERNILSIILNDNDKILDLETAGVKQDHFIVDANRYIYMSIRYLYEINQEPEPLAIIEVIADDKAKKAIQDIGGLEYITALCKNRVVNRNLEIYTKKLTQTYTRRQLYLSSIELQREMLNEDSKVLNPSELIGTFQKKIDDLSIDANNVDEVYEMGADLQSRLDKIIENPMEVPGLETGYYQFDKFTNGMQPSDLLFICARSKVGKSVLLTNMANKIAIHDKLPILYIDTEMPSDQVEFRLLAMNSGVPEEEIKSGMFTLDTEFGKADDKIERIKQAQQLIKDGNLYHIYLPGYSVDKINSLTRKFHTKYGIVALFFDYIKLPDTAKNNLKNLQEYQELGFIAMALKDLAGKLQIPVFSAVQANRVDPKATVIEMNESNIAGSDRILQNASKLVFLANKPDEQIAMEGGTLGNQQLRIAFQRSGSCNVPPINMNFEKKIIRMSEVF